VVVPGVALAQDRAVQPGAVVARVKLDGAREQAFGVVQPAESGPGRGQVIEEIGVRRLQFDGAGVAPCRVLVLAAVQPGAGHFLQRERIAQGCGFRLPQRLDGAGDVTFQETPPGLVQCLCSQIVQWPARRSTAQKFQVTAMPTVRGRAMMLLPPLP
jgi:hypothetical protein